MVPSFVLSVQDFSVAVAYFKLILASLLNFFGESQKLPKSLPFLSAIFPAVRNATSVFARPLYNRTFLFSTIKQSRYIYSLPIDSVQKV